MSVYLGNKALSATIGTTPVQFYTKEDLFIEYLVVAGGGGGGNGNQAVTAVGGGGGAGGYLTGSATIQPLGTTYNIVVGNGGTYNALATSTNGDNSSLIGGAINLVSTGGGRGGSAVTGTQTGGNGGSGGGGAYSSGVFAGGTGISGQGFNGNAGRNTPRLGGCGGGAGSAAKDFSLSFPYLAPGDGKTWLNGVTYARGGYGQGVFGSASAQANTGQGGLGGYNLGAGGNGGSGVVIIRYSGAPRTTGGTITQSDGYTYHTFTGNGSFVF